MFRIFTVLLILAGATPLFAQIDSGGQKAVGINEGTSDSAGEQASGAAPVGGCGSITLGKIEGAMAPEQPKNIINAPLEIPMAAPVGPVGPGGIVGAQEAKQPEAVASPGATSGAATGADAAGASEGDYCGYTPDGQLVCFVGGQPYVGCLALPDGTADCSNAVPAR